MLQTNDETALSSSLSERPAAISENQKYNAAQIDKLEGLEAVRKRPGMYIGDTDERALHHCVSEVLDNSVDEHLAGYCSRIDVTIHVDGSISIRDNGRGIPVDMHPKYKMPGVELVLTKLHSGGKFGQGGYKYSGGTHGVGAKCVNALSEWFKVEVSRDGEGLPHGIRARQDDRETERHRRAKTKKTTGTLITFKPDPTIFTITTEFKSERLASRLRELAFLNPGLEITFTDERTEPTEDGDVLTTRTASRSSSNSSGENKTRASSQADHHFARRTRRECSSRSCCNTTTATTTRFFCYTNTIPNPDGGTHLTGFRSALTRAINQYAKANNLLKEKDPAITGDDVREGLTACLSVKQPDPRFESQTKVKLVNTEVEGIVGSVVYEGLMTYFDAEPADRETDRRQGPDGRPRPRSRAQGARDRPQRRAHRRRLARQAGRLFGARSGEHRALHRRR